MTFPPEIQREAREIVGLTKPDDPLYYTWVFDPVKAEVHISEDHDRPLRHQRDHGELAEKVNHHPDRVHGVAYRIRRGWRISDWEHKPVDEFIAHKVVAAIKAKERE